MESVGLLIGVLSVAPKGRLEQVDMTVAPSGEPLALVFDIGLVTVGTGDLEVGGGEVGLGSLEARRGNR